MLRLNRTSDSRPYEPCTTYDGVTDIDQYLVLQTKLQPLGARQWSGRGYGPITCSVMDCPYPCQYHDHDTSSPGRQFEMEFEDVQTSAAEGCLLCLAFSKIVGQACMCQLKGIRTNPRTPHPCEKVLCRYLRGKIYGIQVTWRCGKSWFALRSPVDTADNLLPLLPRSSGIERDPKSPSALAKYREWFENCISSHGACGTSDEVRLPTRVLDLSDGVIRLVEPAGLRATYAAFSHCWGDTKPLSTLRCNISQHLAGIPMDILPPSFGDLVHLARALGLRYVWIDSLCIIQDDPGDWERESSRMSEIYSEAALVIIAASARSPEAGFLTERKQGCWQDINMRAIRSGMPEQTGELSFCFRDCIDHPGDSNATTGTVINGRAWCYQERLMAKRRLIFRQSEAVWECRTECTCEDMGSGPIGSIGHVQPTYRPLAFPRSGDKVFESPAAAYEFWRDSIEVYSSRRLTFWSDRLPAISALATVVAKETGDEYLAGLWKGDLLHGLMWGVSQDDAPTVPDTFVAPTWSWASLITPIAFDSITTAAFGSEDGGFPALTPCGARLVEADCVRSGQHDFGAIKSASLVLESYYCDVEISISQYDPEKVPMNQTADRWNTFSAGQKQQHYFNIDWAGAWPTLEISIEPDSEMIFDMLPVREVQVPDSRNESTQAIRRDEEQCKTVVTLQRASSGPQVPCAGLIRLLWLANECCLLLTQSQSHFGAYERLGLVRVQTVVPFEDGTLPYTMPYVAQWMCLEDWKSADESDDPHVRFGQVKLV